MAQKDLLNEIVALKERLNSAERKLSDFADMLKAQVEISQTDMEIAQIESERAITDLEIEIAELLTN